MSILDQTLRELIAREFGVSPEMVTLEFLHEWREANIYPNPHYDFRSEYGGYRGSHQLKILTPAEVESNRAKAEAFLARFSGPAPEAKEPR